jgi:HSP20 family protein
MARREDATSRPCATRKEGKDTMAQQTDAKAAVPVNGDGRPAAMARRDPFDLFDALEEEMARIWGSPWRIGPWTLGRPLRRPAPAAAPWTPRMDVFEKDGNLVVKAELPGVKKEDVQVLLDGNDLTIRGERKEEREIKEEDYYRCERNYGSFFRRIPLAFEATAEQITAAFGDGVLEITIPKPAEEKPKSRPIAVT